MAGVKRVEGGGCVTLIPSLSRPATQVTESNKGVNCVVMLRGPVKKEVRLPYYRKLMLHEINGNH